jgi:hypothetical protein
MLDPISSLTGGTNGFHDTSTSTQIQRLESTSPNTSSNMQRCAFGGDIHGLSQTKLGSYCGSARVLRQAEHMKTIRSNAW